LFRVVYVLRNNKSRKVKTFMLLNGSKQLNKQTLQLVTIVGQYETLHLQA
jgi:hypothetical protein